uniref:PX domain containing protein n=1 Tax=Coptotermes formosanus TaxID=36987 RepID=R4V3R7_COPFO|nr:PX domain containing protein [Coptotermes formosanus]
MNAKCCRVEDLSYEKRRMIDNSLDAKSIYLTVESSGMDPKSKTVYYQIEVGVFIEGNINIHVVTLRYSQLSLLNSELTKSKSEWFQNSQIVFPPKSWIQKSDPTFLSDRLEKLKLYLECLTKIPNITSNSTFKEMFKLKF